MSHNIATPVTPSKVAPDVIDPHEDGVTYINIYSRGMTPLGRKLSHFPRTPFTHPVFGPFASMEGFWYYMRAQTHLQPAGFGDQLRTLVGRDAKFYGRTLPSGWYDDFQEDILAANWQKIIQNPEIADMLVESSLPFKHFYIFGPKRLVIIPPRFEWLMDGFDEIRTALKEGRASVHWERASARYAREAAKLSSESTRDS